MSRYLETIVVKNLGGLTEFAAEFPEVAVICGANETGKTSFLESVATIFRGGSDADLLHNGAKKGSVEIGFENGYKALKTIEPHKYSVTVIDPNGGKTTTGAATMIAQWVPKEGFDVRGLLTKLINKPKELEKFLLDNLPLSFDAKEVNAELGDGATPIRGKLTLAEFNALLNGQFTARTDLNRDKEALEGTITTMEGQLPDSDGVDWVAKAEALSSDIGTLNLEKSSIKNRAERELEARIHEERLRVEAEIAKLRKEFSEFEAKKRKEVGEVVAEATAEIDRNITTLSAERATAQAKAQQQTRAAGVQEAIAQARVNLKGFVTREAKLTAAIESLRALKARKLKELPVEGLDIREDEKKNVTITVNDVPLQRLNTQQQIYLCVKFTLEAQKAAGCSMKLMICEGAELDESHLVELGEACKEAGIQLIVSMRVDKLDKLTVVSLDNFAPWYAEHMAKIAGEAQPA